MSLFKCATLVAIFLSSLAFADEDNEDGYSYMDPTVRLQIISERYTDFFARQRELAKEQSLIDAGIPEVKSDRERAQIEEIESRREYVKNRKPHAEDPRLEQEWEREKKIEKEKMEVWRNRYVQLRDKVKAVEERSQKIPEKKEYDLED